MIINDYYIAEFSKYFDFADEYDNKEYVDAEYEFDHGHGLRKYSNTLLIIDIMINNQNKENYILRNF